MKTLVSGGAGFLGSYLCGRLLEKGYEVVCLDNLLTGGEAKIAQLYKNPKFKFLKQDVCQALPDDLQADAVYHLASPASPNLSSPKSYHALAFETMQANSSGTWNLCQASSLWGAKFLFASSSEVYGDPLMHPQTEEYRGNVSTTGPRSVYDEAKRFGETIVSCFVNKKNLDGRIIRIFNTYGPGMAFDDGRAVMEFMLAAKNGQVIPIFGTGSQTRSFCYVSDLVEGMILAMDSPKTSGEVFNLGNPEEFTILELAQKIKQVSASSSEIKTLKPLPRDDPLKRRPDISKAKAILGWQPKVSLDEGLAKLYQYLKGQEE